VRDLGLCGGRRGRVSRAPSLSPRGNGICATSLSPVGDRVGARGRIRAHLWRALGRALAFLLLAAAAEAAEIVGPQLDAAALRAARGASRGPGLQLTFDFRHGDAAGVPLIAQLGTDYVDVVEAGRETLYDFKLKRRLMLDRAQGVFANFSLYGDVAFRRFEVGKRLTLSAMSDESARGEGRPLSITPFWIESDLGMPTGAKDLPKIEQDTLPDGAIRFRAAGQEVALFAPASEAVPSIVRDSYARFLRLRLPLHPEVVAAILRDGRVPQRLVFVTVSGYDRHPVGLVLTKSLRIEADYPLPARLEPRPLAGQAEDQEALSLRGLLPLMLEAVAGKRGGVSRSMAEYRRAVDQALSDRKDFAAALLLAEMTLQYGPTANDCSTGPGSAPCHDPYELSLRFARDPRAAQLYKAQTTESKDQAEASRLWETLRHDDVPGGYIIDVFLADRLSASGHRQEAMGAFGKALQVNPLLTGIYKKLGDHFLRASRTDLAWLCYDLGRALPVQGTDGPLAEVGELEQKLEAQFPDFL
jgi:tetratricopeptide (TPR) repeat protein